MSIFSRGDDARLRGEVVALERARDAALAEAESLSAAIDAVPMGVVLVDSTGVVLLRNRAADLGGRAELLVVDVVDRLTKSARAGEAAEEKVTLQGPPLRVLAVRAVPLPDGRAMAIIDDLSERARLDQVRTDFVSNISHELKTPVGALALLAETLADSDDSEVNRRLANRMVDEAHRAAGTIDDLLELSRIELGGRGEQVEVHVASVLQEAIARHRLTAESAGVALHSADSNGLRIRADRLQLVSALSNLVDNAVKYSNAGGAVRLTATEADGFVEITVSDEGVGIPARDIDRIFERFYRVDRARSRETGGTGLGLAIVRHVATNHGGDVTVRSREGEGSTFTLRIPQQEAGRDGV
ncbi:MAG: sensor histidine kinase [Actinomycetota bacterium]